MPRKQYKYIYIYIYIYLYIYICLYIYIYIYIYLSVFPNEGKNTKLCSFKSRFINDTYWKILLVNKIVIDGHDLFKFQCSVNECISRMFENLDLLLL